GLLHRGDVDAGPDRGTADLGEGLDELGYLAHRHVAVRLRAFVAKAREPALATGREQPQRVPALAAPGVRHFAALQHDVVDRPVAQEVARGKTRVPRADYDRGGAFYDGSSGDFDGDVRRVRQGVEHSGALLGLGHQRLDLLLRRVRVDGERHLDVVEAVADVAVRPEDPADVVRALELRLDRAQLDAAVLGDRGHARGQAAGQADEQVLDRRDAVVGRREDERVVGLERRLGLVLLLLAQAEEAVDL